MRGIVFLLGAVAMAFSAAPAAVAQECDRLDCAANTRDALGCCPAKSAPVVRKETGRPSGDLCPSGTDRNGAGCAPVAASEEARVPGETKPEPKTGLTWVWIPPGTFTLGCEPRDDQCKNDDEKPSQLRKVDGFWLMKTEVTVSAYKACVEAGECRPPRGEDTPRKTCNWMNDRGDHPLNCVNDKESSAFCNFVGARLPSAPEWEYAAKGGQSVVYPWGDKPVTGRLANFCDRNCLAALPESGRKMLEGNGWVTHAEDDGFAGTAPVGSYPAGANAWGLLDMSGNVIERTSTDYSSMYREYRGGGWSDRPSLLRASSRRGLPGSYEADNVGFRCAQ